MAKILKEMLVVVDFAKRLHLGCALRACLSTLGGVALQGAALFR